MTAVADTSALIVLGKVRQLDLLRALYDEVVLPMAVAEEVLAKPDAMGAELRELVTSGAVRPVQNVQLAQSLGVDLGPGESEAIALAAGIGNAILIIDDADARRVARGPGLRVTGVLGVLVEAKSRGLVPLVSPILDALGDEGFWLSKSLRKTILDAVRE